MQRHHLLPRQLLGERSFGKLFEQIGRDRIGFDDFRMNGLLLPAREEAAMRVRMPLHRGPHRDYNGMVAERVGQIEGAWSRLRLRAPEVAVDEALMRLDLLQRALRRRLLTVDRPKMRLNRHDRLDFSVDFADLDAMADALWAGTESHPLPAQHLPPGEIAAGEWPIQQRAAGHPPIRDVLAGEMPAAATSAIVPAGFPLGEMPVEAAPQGAPVRPSAMEPISSPLHLISMLHVAIEQFGKVTPPDAAPPPAVLHTTRH